MSWREISRPIIQHVLAETAGQTEQQVTVALRAAYPFGERRYHPYKVWLNEVRKQRLLLEKRQKWEQALLEI